MASGCEHEGGERWWDVMALGKHRGHRRGMVVPHWRVSKVAHGVPQGGHELVLERGALVEGVTDTRKDQTLEIVARVCEEPICMNGGWHSWMKDFRVLRQSERNGAFVVG